MTSEPLNNKIDYSRIIINTLVKIFLIVLVIFILNTYSLIKSSFTGDIAPLNVWIAQGFVFKNALLLVFFGGYFIFKDIDRFKKKSDESSK